jgi:mRNA interferase RelE/StbE
MSSWTGKGAATAFIPRISDRDFSELPSKIQLQIEKKLDEMGLRLNDYPHYRLTASSECRFRVGDYRVIYEFNVERNFIYVLAVGRRDQIYKRR